MLRAIATALLVALPGSAMATTFVYDAGAAIATGKSDFHVRSDVPSNEKVTALDWNGYGQAIYDLRTALKIGYFHGLMAQTIAPPPLSDAGILLFNMGDGGGLWIEYPDAGTVLVAVTSSNGNLSINGNGYFRGTLFADGGYNCPFNVWDRADPYPDGGYPLLFYADCNGIAWANFEMVAPAIIGTTAVQSNGDLVAARNLTVGGHEIVDGGIDDHGPVTIKEAPNSGLTVLYNNFTTVFDVTRDLTTAVNIDAGFVIAGSEVVTGGSDLGGTNYDASGFDCYSPSFLVKLDGGPAICVGWDSGGGAQVDVPIALTAKSGTFGSVNGSVFTAALAKFTVPILALGGKAQSTFEFDAGATLEGFPAVAYGVNGTGKALWGIQAGRASAGNTGQVVTFSHAFLSPVYCTCACRDQQYQPRCDPNDDGVGATQVTLYATTTCVMQWICVGAETQ